MRFDVALVDCGGVKLALDHDIGFGKALVRVAQSVAEVLSDVADLAGLLAKLFGPEVV